MECGDCRAFKRRDSRPAKADKSAHSKRMFTSVEADGNNEVSTGAVRPGFR